MLPTRDSNIEQAFPEIFSAGYKITSNQDNNYNCIAWAIGDTQNFWWPHPQAYWPNGVERVLTLKAFIKACETGGYIICDNGELEEGFEKIVIFLDIKKDPSHVAKQLPDGSWSSKIGKNHDISHTLEGLANGIYGEPVQYMRRKLD